MVTHVDEDWARLARWIEDVMARTGVTLRAIERGGVGYRTMEKMLRAEPVTRRDALTRLSVALGYEGDAAARVLRGEDPLPVEEDDRLSVLERDVAEVKETLALVVRRLDEAAQPPTTSGPPPHAPDARSDPHP